MGLRHLVIVNHHNKVRLCRKKCLAQHVLIHCVQVVGMVTRKDLANLRSHHQREDFMGTRVDEVAYLMPEDFCEEAE